MGKGRKREKPRTDGDDLAPRPLPALLEVDRDARRQADADVGVRVPDSAAGTGADGESEEVDPADVPRHDASASGRSA
jgi:hypothetical protein